MEHTKELYNRIVNRAELVALVSEWKLQGGKIVFTNGCFDILHRGHVEYLHKAADLGSRLIIGLNSDESVNRLKGNNRPIQSEADRALIIAALRIVDAVCIFGEDTPEELIRAVSPDFLVKGGDYVAEMIAGYSWVRSYGGQVLTIPIVDGYSTTSILQKL